MKNILLPIIVVLGISSLTSITYTTNPKFFFPDEICGSLASSNPSPYTSPSSYNHHYNPLVEQSATPQKPTTLAVVVKAALVMDKEAKKNPVVSNGSLEQLEKQNH